MITNEHLADIEKAFPRRVLVEIFKQYVRCDQRPSEAVREALARVYGKTARDIGAEFDAFAASN